MKKVIFLGLFLASQSQAITVLTYGSFLGKGSIGEAIKEIYQKKCQGCSIDFVTTKELSDLMGRLKSDANGKKSIDVVLGLSESDYQAALNANLVANGQLFDQSPFAFIVDTKKLPKKDWPKNWKELGQKEKSAALVQDPRLSGPGLGWLQAIFKYNLVDLPTSKKISKRVYPSWSASYSAFLKGEGKMVWSFLTSEAYHSCNAKTEEERNQFKALPLQEGYPVQKEFVAITKAKSQSKEAQEFISLVTGEEVQSLIPEKNWMLPALKTVKLPPCYAHLSSIKEVDGGVPPTASETKTWIDEWSL